MPRFPAQKVRSDPTSTTVCLSSHRIDTICLSWCHPIVLQACLPVSSSAGRVDPHTIRASRFRSRITWQTVRTRAHTRVSSPPLLSSSPVCSASIAHCTIAPRGHWPLSTRYRHACSLVSRRHTARSRKAPCCESALFSAPLSSAIYREAMLVPRIDSARHARLRHARNEDGSPCREPIFPKCMFVRSVGIVAFARIPER